MSRPTDSLRGARIAFEAAVDNLHPDLFGLSSEDDSMWESIFIAAADAIETEKWAMAVSRG